MDPLNVREDQYLTRTQVIDLLNELGLLELPQDAGYPPGRPAAAPPEVVVTSDHCPSLTVLLEEVVAAIPAEVQVALEQRVTEHTAAFEAGFGSPVSSADKLRAISMALGELATHPAMIDVVGVERPVSGVSGPRQVPLVQVTERLAATAVSLAWFLGNWRTYSRPVQGGSPYDHLPAWLRHPPKP